MLGKKLNKTAKQFQTPNNFKQIFYKIWQLRKVIDSFGF